MKCVRFFEQSVAPRYSTQRNLQHCLVHHKPRNSCLHGFPVVLSKFVMLIVSAINFPEKRIRNSLYPKIHTLPPIFLLFICFIAILWKQFSSRISFRVVYGSFTTWFQSFNAIMTKSIIFMDVLISIYVQSS